MKSGYYPSRLRNMCLRPAWQIHITSVYFKSLNNSSSAGTVRAPPEPTVPQHYALCDVDLIITNTQVKYDKWREYDYYLFP